MKRNGGIHMNEKHYTIKLHAPDIEPKIRHPKIFEAFDQLKSGEIMHLSNDHNPKPLYYQFLMERKNQFSWEYLEEGPDLWQVKIKKK